ncbi:MAG: cation transporter [Chloroflexi bacterium]|nr:cation transporter [Chloroflexota bacterium]
MFSTRSGAAKLFLIVVLGLITLKIVVAAITGSISILAQAADSALDLIAVGITFLTVNWAVKPPDEDHHYGHGKIEVIAAVVQGLLIFVAGGLIIYSSVRRIMVGSTLELTEAGIAVMFVSVVVNILLSRHLLKVSRITDSMILEANARNIAVDVYSTGGVLVGLVVIRFTGLNIIDPILALAVALLILKSGYDVLRKSFGGLVDVSLPKAEENELISLIMQHSSQVAGFHKIRTRKSGSQRFIDLHLQLPKNASLEEAHRMCYHLEKDIADRLPNSNVTIHVEPCETECGDCLVLTCSLRHS